MISITEPSASHYHTVVMSTTDPFAGLPNLFRKLNYSVAKGQQDGSVPHRPAKAEDYVLVLIDTYTHPVRRILRKQRGLSNNIYQYSKFGEKLSIFNYDQFENLFHQGVKEYFSKTNVHLKHTYGTVVRAFGINDFEQRPTTATWSPNPLCLYSFDSPNEYVESKVTGTYLIVDIVPSQLTNPKQKHSRQPRWTQNASTSLSQHGNVPCISPCSPNRMARQQSSRVPAWPKDTISFPCQ